MTDEIISQALLALVTFIANFFASMSGGGAGFVQFPALILLGLPFATALGTHKVAVVFLGIGAITKKLRAGPFALDRTVCVAMIAVALTTVIAGSVIIVSVPAKIAQTVLGIITIATGFYSICKRGFGTTSIENRSLARTILGTLALFAIGIFSGSFSSGTGIFSTLILVGIFGMDIKNAILHTMIFVGSLWNAVGAVTVGAMTDIHWQWLPVMIISTFAGAYCGASLMTKMNPGKIKILFSGVCMISGILLIAQPYIKLR